MTSILNTFYGCFQNILFSSYLNVSSPYKSKCSNNLSTRKGILYARRMGFTVPKRALLWIVKLGQWSKKWHVVPAIPIEQLKATERGCSYPANVGKSLWIFRGLSYTRSWKIHLMPLSWTLKMLLFTRRYSFKSVSLNFDIDSNSRRLGPKSFHIDTLSVKKLLRYLLSHSIF